MTRAYGQSACSGSLLFCLRHPTREGVQFPEVEILRNVVCSVYMHVFSGYVGRSAMSTADHERTKLVVLLCNAKALISSRFLPWRPGPSSVLGPADTSGFVNKHKLIDDNCLYTHSYMVP